MWGSAELGMKMAIARGWKQSQIGIDSALIVVIVLTVLLGLALNNATTMRNAEQEAIGVINDGFKELASYVSIVPGMPCSMKWLVAR
jgi:hypothetical protein